MTNRLLVALDVDTPDRALTLAGELRGLAGGFKIGSRLFTAAGPDLVRALVDHGDRVFLDLKYHDIPNVVASAIRAAGILGVWMLTVHASGGAAMMREAARAAADMRDRSGGRELLVVGVTVLTSLGDDDLTTLGIGRPLMAQVETLASLAQSAGLDGIVASPHEAGLVRQRCGQSFAIVTPGIRPRQASHEARAADDQVRVATAADAIAAGADYLVVGRPIIAAADPRAATERLLEEIGS